MGSGSKHSSAGDGQTMPRVMVVEDEVLIRLAIADDLRREGFEVLEAGSGDEALALLDGGVAVDLIFTDVSMPGAINGIGLTETVTNVFPEISVVLTSANEVVLDSDRLQNVPFLSKPYLPAEVVNLIRAQLNERDGQDADDDGRRRNGSARGRGDPRPA